MTARRGHRCRGCNARLTYRFAALTRGGHGVQRVYECPGCRRWHGITVTDPSEAAELATSLTNGDPT
jgi:hypothetical protein